MRLEKFTSMARSNILTKPEFANREKLRELSGRFEEKSRLVKILNECSGERSYRSQCESHYRRREHRPFHERLLNHHRVIPVGSVMFQAHLGVVGPTRIEYGRTMAVVNYLARFIERRNYRTKRS